MYLPYLNLSLPKALFRIIEDHFLAESARNNTFKYQLKKIKTI